MLLGNWAGSAASGQAKPGVFCAEKIRGLMKLPGQKASRYKTNADRSGRSATSQLELWT
jgi:hypothetical protein